VQHARAHAGAGRGVAGHAVAGGDEGVGAVVDVQQRALRAFEQQVGAVQVASFSSRETSAIMGLSSFGLAHGLVVDRLELNSHRPM
jgi:hypothetical protein